MGLTQGCGAALSGRIRCPGTALFPCISVYLKEIPNEINGRRGGTRTPDPRIRNPLLYPPELHARKRLWLDDIDEPGSSQMDWWFGDVLIWFVELVFGRRLRAQGVGATISSGHHRRF